MKDLLNKIHLADNMDIMAQLPDNSIDLAIVDPPYGIGQGGGNNNTRSKKAKAKNYKDFGDTKSPNKEYFIELFRVSKNQIIFGANHFISKIPYDSPCWIIWDKCNGKNDFADCELAWTSFKTSVRNFKFKWAGMLQENMKQKEIRIHPTQKPVALYRWLLHNYAKKSDIILDTHCGSASSVIACIEDGFNYIACENDKDYHAASIKRIQPYLDQGKLF